MLAVPVHSLGDITVYVQAVKGFLSQLMLLIILITTLLLEMSELFPWNSQFLLDLPTLMLLFMQWHIFMLYVLS